MPFDSTKPANNSPLSSTEMRNQLNALKALNDALQAQLNNAIAGTALNPNGQFVNFDPNWSPSGDSNADFIYIRDRITDLYTILSR